MHKFELWLDEQNHNNKFMFVIIFIIFEKVIKYLYENYCREI